MLVIAFGTRPEWLKIKPVIVELKNQSVEFGLIFTGQHEDLVSAAEVMEFGAKWFSQFKLLSNVSSNRLDNIASQILSEPFEEWMDVTSLMVQGDTTSAFAMALAAFHRRIPVIHLEAGLRTYDSTQPFPEEANRQMISSLASVHLCPTKWTAKNLGRENVSGEIHIVGNTVLDNLKDVQTSEGNKILVTMHRRENHESLEAWFRTISALASIHVGFEFILPIHPNPEVKKCRDFLGPAVTVVDPLSHEELIKILADCKGVITDSGGIQEEAAFLRKPCVVCRERTERTEGIGNFSLLCKTPFDLQNTFTDAMVSLPMEGPCPYGDGNSAKRVVEIVKGL